MSAARLPVLMYHRIGRVEDARDDRYSVTPSRFREHMDALRREGMQAVPLDKFRDWLDGGDAPPDGSFVLTFDDGFLGVHEHAAPALLRLGWPAAVFLVSGLLGGHDDWTRTVHPNGARHPLMGPRHVRELNSCGFSFQSHTRSHLDLTTLAATDLADELYGSRATLEDLVGARVDCIAYPFGRYDDGVIEAARAAGYRTGFTTQPGFNRPGIDLFKVRRLDVFGTDTATMLVRKARFGSNNGDLLTLLQHYGRRVAIRARIR